MARTTPTLKIKNNGTLLGAGSFTTLDLLTNLSAVDSGAGIAGMSATGGATGTNIATEVVIAVTSGSNVTIDLTTLSHTFVVIEMVFRNGQNLTPTTDWTRSSNTITVTDAVSSDVYQVQYTY